MICYETVSEENRVFLACQHEVCIICYQKMINVNPRCPFCRTAILGEPFITDLPEEARDDIETRIALDRVVAVLFGMVLFYYAVS